MVGEARWESGIDQNNPRLHQCMSECRCATRAVWGDRVKWDIEWDWTLAMVGGLGLFMLLYFWSVS